MGISCIEETVRFGEEAGQNGAQGAASAMGGNGTYGICLVYTSDAADD